jgi:PAS domain S-box-containing protein
MHPDVAAEDPAHAALRFQAEALAQVGDAVIIIDNAQRITYLNAKAAAQYAVEPAVALGRPLSSLHQHLWLEPADEEAAFRELKQSGRWQGANIHVLPGGKQLYVESTVTVLKDQAGEPAGMLAVIRDVTAQKQAEAALVHAHQRTLLAEAAAHGFIYEWNLQTGAVTRSPNMYQMLGYRREELAGDLPSWRALIHPDDFPGVDATGLTQIMDVKEYSFEYRLRHRAGHYLYDWDKGIVDRDAAGQPVRLVGITMDISERKQLEQELYEIKERFRLAMDMVHLSIVETDKELRYTWIYNPYPDLTVQDLIGRRVDEPFSPGGEVPYLHILPEVLVTGIGRRTEFSRTFADGLHTYETIIEPTRAASGQIVGLTIVAMDVTQRKQAEEELQRLTRELQEFNKTLEERVAERTAELQRSNRELDRFAYIASHDLKAPLRAIDHLAAWIAEDSTGTLSPVSQEHLVKLRGRVKRLEGLLDALLHYSRAGRRRHPSQWLDTAAVVQDVAELLNPPDGFQVVVKGDLPRVCCEQAPFETLLRNLIENAIKHHDRPYEGKVTVSAATRGDFVEFHVHDNGPGIAPQYHARIFEVFQTLKPRDDVEGSGMGLAIAKKTVESAGGEIWVESSVGKGATFCFTWPLRASDAGEIDRDLASLYP